jgi:hypothetical protein
MSRQRAQKGQLDQALGRSRGGFSTKIHLKTDFGGLPIAFHLTGGEASIHLFAEGDPVELVEHRFEEALTEAVSLYASGEGRLMSDVFIFGWKVL